MCSMKLSDPRRVQPLQYIVRVELAEREIIDVYVLIGCQLSLYARCRVDSLLSIHVSRKEAL